jgi:large subunit ribosomal protein L17
MRHRKKGRKLNRRHKQRQALFKGLIRSLILKEEIKTTEAKAKAIKGLTDKLISKAKSGSLSARRQVLAFLPDKQAVDRLFDVIVPRVKHRTSGFTRLIRLNRRQGDNALVVKMELVDKTTPDVAKPAKKTPTNLSRPKTSKKSPK